MSTITYDKLIGEVFTDVSGKRQDEEFILTNDNFYVAIYVPDDCCNQGWLEDVDGDIKDLLESPITMFEEVGSRERDIGYDSENHYQDSCTWTYYKIGSEKGSVTLRFVGTSNGYYCERADVHIEEKSKNN